MLWTLCQHGQPTSRVLGRAGKDKKALENNKCFSLAHSSRKHPGPEPSLHHHSTGLPQWAQKCLTREATCGPLWGHLHLGCWKAHAGGQPGLLARQTRPGAQRAATARETRTPGATWGTAAEGTKAAESVPVVSNSRPGPELSQLNTKSPHLANASGQPAWSPERSSGVTNRRLAHTGQ